MLPINRGIRYDQNDFTTNVIGVIGIQIDCRSTRVKIISVFFPEPRHRRELHHFRSDLRKITEGDIPTVENFFI